ncbi:peptide chain release factor N(5)-glutamine methyltransferase [Falsirhodobacter halotolerans]|uniref:peptide chain release factor N(5)-glutamine methyltransferase n=1 Tax=Falsirhodobacter halotolerans TaxID=1146892 RepID=UPI001FD5B0FC|nr:peptide chain release factor N(5)-glutamine methyltransferase [Falsirhodobacter halotolerans]MCJ8139770.1 peptide chain release factor N(5)-glutamine methyltransferase [Falsirhodobacter halotolerans]
MTIAEALRHAAARLKAAGLAGAARDARWLVAHAAGLPADRLILHADDPLDPERAIWLDRAVEERSRHRPVAHITGLRQFHGRTFRVTSDTLDPRPETETLIHHALGEEFSSILDLGTGTGILGITLVAETGARGVATDLSAAALDVARQNARAHDVTLAFVQSDWFEGVEGRFDLIVSNPPYIAEDEMAGLSPDVRLWEPAMALTPGGDGLGPYRSISAAVSHHLHPGGRVIVEIGPTQGAAVSAMFHTAGLQDVAVHPDLDGRDRVVMARKR